MLRRAVAAIALAAMGLGAGGVATTASAAGTPVDIDIVAMNDFHGRIATAPQMAGMVNSFEAANPNTVFVAAGDLIGASTFESFIQQDNPTIDVLNMMGLDSSSFGNHEFDKGTNDIITHVEPRAAWNYTAANLFLDGTTTPAFPEYYVQEFQGVRVAFIGAVTEELGSLVSPDGIATLDVAPIVPNVNRVATALTDGELANDEADVVMLLIHEGASTTGVGSVTDDSVFGKIVKGVDVDAIISAHTHLAYNHTVPIGPDAQVGPVISTGQYGENYGHLDLQVDSETKQILLLAAEVKALSGFTPDQEVADFVAAATAQAAIEGAVPLGNITGSFERAIPGPSTTPGAPAPKPGDSRGGESTLGNFVADVQLWAAQDTGRDTQIAFMNPGGLRDDLRYAANPAIPGDVDGRVTYSEAALVQSFANTLVWEQLTGEQIRLALEQQWQPSSSSRPFLKLGVSAGLKYTFDATRPVGTRITSITLNGAPLDPGATYNVVVNSFLAGGGDNFGALNGANKQDTGRVDLQSMVDWFAEFGTATPDLAQRSISVQLSAPDSDGYSTGDQVTLTLASLLMSRGGPAEAEVVVSANGVELGRSPIDPTLTPELLDYSGKATVVITLPPTGAGMLVLNIAVPAAGTSFDVPITVTQQAITNVTPPAITGQARVNRTLTASGGSWSVADPQLAYQWNRNGTPIDGATASSYTVRPADAGASITVTVTASKDGYGNGTATSAAKAIAKGSSDTDSRLNRLIVGTNGTVRITVEVDGQYGIAPVGEVQIYDGSRVIATATLTAADNGRVTLTLPNLGRGIHLVSARFGGSDQLTGSSSFPSLLLQF